MEVKHDNKIVCKGIQSKDGLWRLPLVNSKAYQLTGLSGAANHIAFDHAALFSPALSTLKSTLKRLCAKLPGFVLSKSQTLPTAIHCNTQRALRSGMYKSKHNKAAYQKKKGSISIEALPFV